MIYSITTITYKYKKTKSIFFYSMELFFFAKFTEPHFIFFHHYHLIVISFIHLENNINQLVRGVIIQKINKANLSLLLSMLIALPYKAKALFILALSLYDTLCLLCIMFILIKMIIGYVYIKVSIYTISIAYKF